jgi:hypothetical protein
MKIHCRLHVSCSGESLRTFTLLQIIHLDIVTCMSDYRRGFGLITGFIGLFDAVCDYKLQFTITHASVHNHVFTAVAW